MRILVCVKFVPSVTDEVPMDEHHTQIRDGVTHQLNVADGSAVELALRLRGKGSVTVMTMGKLDLVPGLRELLARGVNEAVILTDRLFAGADTYATAKTLAKAVKALGFFDLILCGRRAIDGETGQVPAELAAFLEIPCVTNVISAEMGEFGLCCTRLVEDGTMELQVPGNTVVSLCEYSFILRKAGILGMREAREKNVQILCARELGISRDECGLKGSATRVRSLERQITGLRHVKIITDTEMLAERLKEGMV